MALVRISRALRDSIENNIATMRSTELRTLPVGGAGILDASDPVFFPVIDLCMQHLYAAAPACRGLLPDVWCSHLSVVYIRYHEPGASAQFLTVINWPSTENVPPGPLTRTIHIYEDNDALDDLIAISTERGAKRDAAEAKYGAVDTQIRQFLNGQPSLNAALKVLPQLSLYIDKAFLDRVNAGVEKLGKVTGAAQSELGVDCDLITAVGVGHKLTASLGALRALPQLALYIDKAFLDRVNAEVEKHGKLAASLGAA